MRRLLTIIFLIGTALRGTAQENLPSLADSIVRDTTLRSPGVKRVAVHLLHGSLEVRTGTALRARITRRIRADSQTGLARARRSPALRVSRVDSVIDLFQPGRAWHRPMRDGYRPFSHRDIPRVADHVILTLPGDVDLDAVILVRGSIAVHNWTGRFDLHTGCGNVVIDAVDGGGQATTDSGSLRITYRRDPRNTAHFGTLNGNIDILLPPNPDADLRVLARFGEAWSAPAFTYRPHRAPRIRTRGTMQRIQSDPFTGIRLGNGAPVDVHLVALGGDIHIRDAAQPVQP